MEHNRVADATEFWQRGPVPGIPALLQPVAHTLLQVEQEVLALSKEIDPADLWKKHSGLASPGFHLLHITGVLDRLFTYAAGKELSPAQWKNLFAESGDGAGSVADLVSNFSRQVAWALSELAEINPETLTQTRYVGRKKISSTQIGLLFHAAEHLMRHTGQLLVTVKRSS